jgi:hypothetical protein
VTLIDELPAAQNDGPIRTGHSTDPTIRQRWRRARVLIGAAVVLVLGAIIVALGSGKSGTALDPRSYTPSGSHAISFLLGKRGVHVFTDTDLGADDFDTSVTTLVVVSPQYLSSDELATIKSTPVDLVIVGAGLDEIQALGMPLATQPDDGGKLRQPSCSLPAATVAGSAQLQGDGYTVPSGGQGCYPDGDGFALVTFEKSGHRVTLLSDGTPLMNSSLAKDGNAALALGLLDAHPDVVWLVPPAISPASSAGGSASVQSLLPSRLKLAFLQLVIAVIVIAIWRGRRLGRLVPEDLPVVVRQSETVRGRSRLYRRSRSLDTAADALREGTRDRLGHRLGLGHRPLPAALVQAVAARARQPAAQVEVLLYGSTPADDLTLVTLAQALTALEQEVLRT